MSREHDVVCRRWSRVTLGAVLVGVLAVTSGLPWGSLAAQGVACSDDSWEDDDVCNLWPFREFELGGSEAHRLCDPDWLHFTVQPGMTYRISTHDLEGGADTLLRLRDYDSSTCSSIIDYDDNSGDGLGSVIEYTAERTRGLTAEVVSTLGGYVDGMAYKVTIERTARRYVVPVVAHTRGVGGVLFTSDLWVHNPSDEAVELELVFKITGQADVPRGLSRTLGIGAGEVVEIRDVLTSLFGALGSGALEIVSPGVDLVVWSQTCAAGGGAGGCQEVGAIGVENTRLGWSPRGRSLVPLVASAEHRTNLGLTETLGWRARVGLVARDRGGAELATRFVEVPAHGHVQINDALSFLGLEPRDDAWVMVVGFGSPALVTYASVVDNNSLDARLVTGLEALQNQYVARAAGGDGWATELDVVNPWVDPQLAAMVAVTVTFYPEAVTPSGSVGQRWFLGPGEVLHLEDAVRAVGGDGRGALGIHSAPVGVAVSSRTFREHGAGTLGHVVPAATDGDLIGLGGGTATAVGLGTGSKVSWLNASYEDGEVTVRLVAAMGEVLGEATYGLEPWRTGFIDDVFAELGVVPASDVRVELEVVEGGAELLAGAVVKNQQTGDTVYVPAAPLHARPARTIELDARDETLVVDLLEQAVGVEALPEGTYRAEVTGSGDLGAEHLPLQALCLYRHTSGVQRAVVAGPGDSMSGVAGGQPFWCVVPDWKQSDDNTGALQVRLSGAAGEITFALDARANSVLVDRRPEAEISVLPGSRYSVTAAGHLGDEVSSPEALVMFKDHLSGELKVFAVGEGDGLRHVAPWDQLLAVVVDLDSAEPRTGTVRLQPRPH